MIILLVVTYKVLSFMWNFLSMVLDSLNINLKSNIKFNVCIYFNINYICYQSPMVNRHFNNQITSIALISNFTPKKMTITITIVIILYFRIS